MRTPFAAAMLIGTVLLSPVAHAASIAGNVSCSGELSSLSATFVHLSCAGDLSLSDAVVADPIKLSLEASGSLTLLRSTLEAPEIVLVAPQIYIGAELTLVLAGSVLHIAAAMPQSLPLSGASGATLTPPIGDSQPYPGVSHPGGSLQFGRDGDASVAVSQNSGDGGEPPLSITSSVPEPSAALLLAAGLGMIALRRNIGADRR